MASGRILFIVQIKITHQDCNRVRAGRVTPGMNASMKLALEACAVATIITTVLDATGYFMFSALALTVLLPAYAWRAGLRPAEMGFSLYIREQQHWYGFAFLAPLLMIGLIALMAVITGAATFEFDGRKVAINLLLQMSVGILMVAITEEGFFRGLIWTLMEKAGVKTVNAIFLNSILFLIWHLYAATLTEEFAPPLAQLPIFLVNAILLGVIWSCLRELSGSLWVPSVYHAVWNALAYTLFGFGQKTGALDVEATWLFGPEIGLAGLALNVLVSGWLLSRVISSSRDLPQS